MSGGRYVGTPAAAGDSRSARSTSASRIQTDSYLELQATLRTSGVGGIVFDDYATTDFKFVALDVAGQRC